MPLLGWLFYVSDISNLDSKIGEIFLQRKMSLVNDKKHPKTDGLEVWDDETLR